MEPPAWPHHSSSLPDVLAKSEGFLAEFKEAWPKWWLTLTCVRPDDAPSWTVLYLEALGLLTTEDPEMPLEFMSDHIFVASGPCDFSDITHVVEHHQPLQLFGVEAEWPSLTQDGEITSAFLSEQSGPHRLLAYERRLMCAALTWRLHQRQQYSMAGAWREAEAVGYGTPQHLIADQLGLSNYNIQPTVDIAAPLPLECNFAQSGQVQVRYRRPFLPDTFQVMACPDGKLRPKTAAARAIGHESKDRQHGWYIQSFEVPTHCQRVWLSHPLFGSRMLRLDAPYQQATLKPLETLDYLVAAVYRTGSDSIIKAAERWRKGLTSGNAAEQEPALANALARLGFSVLFGGVWTQGEDGDLIVIDHDRARAVLIDAHAVHKGPGVDAVRKKVAELQDRVAELSKHAKGWSITGAVVSNIEQEQVPSISLPQRVHVLGVGNIERLAELSRASEAESLLWPPNSSVIRATAYETHLNV